MAGLRLLGFKLGHVQRDLGLLNHRVGGLRLRHPGIHVIGHQRRQAQGLGQYFGLCIGLAHQLIQRQFLDAQVIVGGDFLGRAEVKTGLRLAGVGDGGGAHFKIAFGGGQLLSHGRLLRLDEVQTVLRAQDVEVGLADANNQVLVGGQELCLGQIHLQHALLIRRLVGWSVERL